MCQPENHDPFPATQLVSADELIAMQDALLIARDAEIGELEARLRQVQLLLREIEEGDGNDAVMYEVMPALRKMLRMLDVPLIGTKGKNDGNRTEPNGE